MIIYSKNMNINYPFSGYQTTTEVKHRLKTTFKDSFQYYSKFFIVNCFSFYDKMICTPLTSCFRF